LLEAFFFKFDHPKPSLGSREVPQKCGPDWFCHFDIYWIQTERQTCKVYIDRQKKNRKKEKKGYNFKERCKRIYRRGEKEVKECKLIVNGPNKYL